MLVLYDFEAAPPPVRVVTPGTSAGHLPNVTGEELEDTRMKGTWQSWSA